MGVVLLFIFFKGIRSSVLVHDPVVVVEVFLLSFPNFCEAVVGMLVLTSMGLVLNERLVKPDSRLGEQTIYVLAMILAGIYVILQEFKIHNLGGRNVYDPYDVLFSVIGVGSAYCLVSYLQPRIEDRA